MTDVMFKNVDEKILREFKAEATREGKTFGQALVEAFLVWLEQKQFSKKKKKMSLLDLKPVSFGPGSEKGSIEVDKIVYSR